MKSKYGNDYSVNPEYEKRMERNRVSIDEALGRDRNETGKKIRLFSGKNISWIITIVTIAFINYMVTYANYTFTFEGWVLVVIICSLGFIYRVIDSIRNGEMKTLKFLTFLCFVGIGVALILDESVRAVSYKSVREYDNKEYVVIYTFHRVRVYEINNPFWYLKEEVDDNLKSEILK